MKRGIPMELRPTQRFPEFIGQKLHDVRLGEVTEESTARNGSRLPPASVMGVRKEDGIVQMEGRLVAADISRYKLVGSNWFAYNPMRLNIGSIARWQGDSVVLVSPDYVVFRCLEQSMPAALHPEYLDHFRRSSQWDAFVNEAGDGGVRVRIYYRDISQLRLIVPDVVEQQKIADCLGSLDDLIAAEGRKLEALRRHKQGLMQQLFPQPGETVPRLRFPEFRNAADWKTKILGTQGRFLSSLTGKAAKDFDTGDAAFIPYMNVFSNAFTNTTDLRSVNVADDESQSAVAKGDVFLTVSSETPEEAGMSSVLLEEIGNCYLNSFCALFRFDEGKSPDPVFLGYLLRSAPARAHLSRGAQGATRYNISRATFRSLPILIPSGPEQKKIADCLGPLDDLIAAEGRKLDSLRQHKRGLIQQLFPSLEGH